MIDIFCILFNVSYCNAKMYCNHLDIQLTKRILSLTFCLFIYHWLFYFFSNVGFYCLYIFRQSLPQKHFLRFMITLFFTTTLGCMSHTICFYDPEWIAIVISAAPCVKLHLRIILIMTIAGSCDAQIDIAMKAYLLH